MGLIKASMTFIAANLTPAVKVIIPIFVPCQAMSGAKRKVRKHTEREREKKRLIYYNLLVPYQVFVTFQKLNNH